MTLRVPDRNGMLSIGTQPAQGARRSRKMTLRVPGKNGMLLVCTGPTKGIPVDAKDAMRPVWMFPETLQVVSKSFTGNSSSVC